MARMVRGHAAKLHVPLDIEPPTSAVLDVARRFWCWTATDASGHVQPVVHCFSGSPGALAGLEVTDGASTWLTALGDLRPDLALESSSALLTTWDDDRWVTFAYSGFGAASRPGDEDIVRAPLGRVHIAGEHTAGTEWAGLMEGALRSGLRAADTVHAGGCP
jgi:monoamine oxidase